MAANQLAAQGPTEEAEGFWGGLGTTWVGGVSFFRDGRHLLLGEERGLSLGQDRLLRGRLEEEGPCGSVCGGVFALACAKETGVSLFKSGGGPSW